MSRKEHGLYKYVYKDEIIYIGLSNSSIRSRIEGHSREDKFQPYLDKCKIFVYDNMPNSTETILAEKALINKYKPILNVTDNQEGYSQRIVFEEPEWISYEQYLLKHPFKLTRLGLKKNTKIKTYDGYKHDLKRYKDHYISVSNFKESISKIFTEPLRFHIDYNDNGHTIYFIEEECLIGTEYIEHNKFLIYNGHGKPIGGDAIIAGYKGPLKELHIGVAEEIISHPDLGITWHIIGDNSI